MITVLKCSDFTNSVSFLSYKLQETSRIIQECEDIRYRRVKPATHSSSNYPDIPVGFYEFVEQRAESLAAEGKKKKKKKKTVAKGKNKKRGGQEIRPLCLWRRGE